MLSLANGRPAVDVDYIVAREMLERTLARASIQAGARDAHIATADRYRDMLVQHRRSAHEGSDAPAILPTGRGLAT